MKKSEIILTPEIAGQVAALYHDMETAYDAIAETLNFSCAGCGDNCCDSFFLHYTYTEWTYLWQGLRTLDEDVLQDITAKAARCVRECEAALAEGKRPLLMCPLNRDGLCALYSHRLMICRLHGVPAAFTMPDGRQADFPGCFRCQEMITAATPVTPLDRTMFFRRMVELELALLGRRRIAVPKVKLTIAHMIVKGPPSP